MNAVQQHISIKSLRRVLEDSVSLLEPLTRQRGAPVCLRMWRALKRQVVIPKLGRERDERAAGSADIQGLNLNHDP